MWHKATVGNFIPLWWLLLPLLLRCTVATPTSSRGGGARATTTAAATTTTTTTHTTPTTMGGEVIGVTSLAAAATAAAAAASASAAAAAAAETTAKKEAGSNKRNYLDDLMLSRSANLLLEDLQQPNGQLINLTRHHDGDIFRTNGIGSCNADTCIGLSSGTAGLVHTGLSAAAGQDGLGQASAVGSLAGGSTGQLELLTRRFNLKLQQQQAAARQPQSSNGNGDADEETCTCRCLPYLRAYREDLGICVDDIHECALSPFVSGSSSEKIPFVFLPLRGQIIYPSREISFPNIQTPVCAVTGAQYLSSNGWSDLRNPIDTDYPFRMFRDEGRSFLQWLGETDLRQRMQGRLIVVHLVCRDMTVALNISHKDSLMTPKNVFSPCVAFRVNGSPVKHTHNVPEVFFQPANSTTLASISDGMTMREYVVIGICSLLLGLIYVASVFLYLYMKKRKSRDHHNSRNSLNNLGNEINYPKNDQVTYGAPFSRVGSIYSVNSIGTGNGNEPNTRTSLSSLKDDLGIVKNNPLLQHFPQLGERELNSGFASDISNSNSECEMDDKIKTSVMVHPQLGAKSNKSPKAANGVEKGSLETDDFLQDNECLPTENVAVIEDIMSEEKLENLRALVNGTVRKKLYFNPAYFEPHLLAEPPQAAIEFLQKIREVIAIAKYKMAAKRYQPNLNIIPEEVPLDKNAPATSMYNLPLQPNQSRSLGDKRNSIEKWLQSVPNTETSTVQPAPKTLDRPAASRSPNKTSTNQSNGNASARGSLRKDISPPKERPPPPPTPKPKQQEEQTASKQARNATSQALESQQRGSKSPSASPNAAPLKLPLGSAYQSYTSYSAAANVYGFAETGTDIYNNPKFMLTDSPTPSMRSEASNRSKSLRKRHDALEQLAGAISTPTSLNSFDRQHYNMLRNMKPDIIYDSLKREYTARVTTLGSFPLDIPTPDYDSTIEKKIKDIYSSTQSSIPSVPTPDYSSLSRKSLKQFQPDSPIYRRKSPQYLIVDYETDSLERLEPAKRKSSHSSSSPSSDVSSQLSPSLSTALPLEEELEISHTVYDRLDGFRKEGEQKKRVANKNGPVAQKHKEAAARIKYDTPFRGSMTIEVEHEPPSDLERTDSDQFEPDTLDRKPKKHSFCDINAWDVHGRRSVTEMYGESEYNQINSLPDLSRQVSPTPSASKPRTASFILKSSNSFRNLREIYESPLAAQLHSKGDGKTYESVAEKTLAEEGRLLTLEAKHTRRQRGIQTSPTLTVVDVSNVNASVNKTTIRISSPEGTRSSMYKEPQKKSPTPAVEPKSKYSPTGKLYAAEKLVGSRNTPTPQRSNANQHYCVPLMQSNRPLPPPPPAPPAKPTAAAHYQNERLHQQQQQQQKQQGESKSHSPEEDTYSMHSEITEVTGVSDTMANSEFENSCNNTLSSAVSSPAEPKKADHGKQSKHIDDALSKEKKSSFDNDYDGLYNKKIHSLRNDYSLTKYLNRRKSSHQRDEENMENAKDMSDAELTSNNNNNGSKIMKDVDLSQFDALSISSRSNRSSSHLSERTKEMYRNAGVPVGIAYPQRAANSSMSNISSNSNTTSVQTVYRCEIEPTQLTAGMQIAIGLKDRAKKAKDLKNAWRKFVTMAASKFSPSQSPAPTYGNKNSNGFLETIDRDEGISSIIEDAAPVSVVQHSFGAPPPNQNYYEQRFGVRPGELDSGYMSTDSTELYKRNVYDRYNFRMMAGGGRGHIIRVDTIEDHSEGGNEDDPTDGNILESSRFEDLEHMVSPGSRENQSDAESDKTLTRSSELKRGSTTTISSYSSEDERGQGRGNSTYCGSSETDEETNAEDMWESGAESIETHSVLYKMIRKS